MSITRRWREPSEFGHEIDLPSSQMFERYCRPTLVIALPCTLSLASTAGWDESGKHQLVGPRLAKADNFWQDTFQPWQDLRRITSKNALHIHANVDCTIGYGFIAKRGHTLFGGSIHFASLSTLLLQVLKFDARHDLPVLVPSSHCPSNRSIAPRQGIFP